MAWLDGWFGPRVGTISVARYATTLNSIEDSGRPSDRPAFEIMTNKGCYRIYANGTIVGFEDDGGECIVINRIPMLVEQAKAEAAARDDA